MTLIFLVLALVCFLMATFNVPTGVTINLTALGLAFVVISQIVPLFR